MAIVSFLKKAVVLKRFRALRKRQGSPCPACLSFGGVCAFWGGLILSPSSDEQMPTTDTTQDMGILSF